MRGIKQTMLTLVLASALLSCNREEVQPTTTSTQQGSGSTVTGKYKYTGGYEDTGTMIINNCCPYNADSLRIIDSAGGQYLKNLDTWNWAAIPVSVNGNSISFNYYSSQSSKTLWGTGILIGTTLSLDYKQVHTSVPTDTVRIVSNYNKH